MIRQRRTTLKPGRRHYVAIFLISLSLLMLQIAVARVLSVALASHFAFVAISLSMFGLGLGALAVYLLPGLFRAERLDGQLVSCSACFALAAVLSMIAFLRLQVVQELSWQGFLTLTAAYAVLAVPFFFAGVCIALLMTHCAVRIGSIYFADLVGAGIGCLAVVLSMELVPAPWVAVLVGLTVAALAVGLASAAPVRRLAAPLGALVGTALLTAAALSTDLLRMRYVKTWPDFYSIYESWNSFSRVSVFPTVRRAAQFVPLKPSARRPDRHESPETMMIDIDGGAWTPMMRFDGDRSALAFLRGSVLYAAHHLKPGARVLVIGTGGGRDLLAAQAFEQPSTLGIELNPLVRRAVQEVYGDYSGRPYTLPGVEVVVDEARSHPSMLERRFDVIQLSLIDTFSLNATGGLVFSENYLYTREGFQEYFRRLDQDGIFTVSRYHMPRYKLEILRLAGLVREAWAAEGVANPADHIVVLGQGRHFSILGKRSPFTGGELARLEEVARESEMTVLFRPDRPNDDFSDLDTMLTTADFKAFVRAHPFLIDPPTDDKPFFFNFLRGRLAPADILDVRADPFQFVRMWNETVLVMYLLIAVVTLLAAVFFFGPLLLVRRRQVRLGAAAAAPLLLYFACLGYGFMMIEVPLLQRFVLLLGYPVYALTVVLFALLLFSGIGSLISTRFADDPHRALLAVLPAVVVAAAYAYAVPLCVQVLLGVPLLLRVVATVILLAPLGLLLGMAYPLGVGVLRRYDEGLIPWAWALNGAFSVVASVGAVFVGSRIGFSAAFLTGVAAYGIALLVMVRARSSPSLAALPILPEPEKAETGPAAAERALG